MAQPNSYEQYLLELVNRFRMAPAAELDWLVNSSDEDVNEALAFFGLKAPDGTISPVLTAQFAALTVASQPLAWSVQLHDSATAHNQLMITNNSQSHFFPGELGYLARMEAAGSDRYTAVAENIYAFAVSPFYAHAGLTVDWGNTSTGIQDPPGHRISLLNNLYTEAGFSIVPSARLNSNDVGPLVVTQHLANRNTGATEWLLGVAFRDMDDNDFYSVGEGLGGVTVNVVGSGGFNASVQTNEAGGYQTLVPQQGTYTVSFVQNGSTLNSYSVSVGTENKKQDLMLAVGVAPNAGFGKIVGVQFNDINGDGTQNIGESGIAGRTVFIDANGNRQRDGSELAATTDANGVYIFNNVVPGTYRLLPVLPIEREQTFPGANALLGNERFQLDDGKNEGARVVSASGADVLVFNQFEVPVGQEALLTSISVLRSPAWANYPGLSNPEKLFIYQDADGDSRPDADEKVLEVTPAITGIDGFANVAVAPTTVSGRFFVGALYAGNGTDFTLVPQDVTAPAGRSWQAISADPNSFSAVQSTGVNWLLRANSAGLQAQVVTVEANETVGGVNFSDREETNLIIGTSESETLNGTNGKDSIFGLAGNDSLFGQGGNDLLEGGDGDDILNGGSEADLLRGGEGNDRLQGSDDNDELYGNNGNDILLGGNNTDTLNGDAGNDHLFGGNGNDTLNGGEGDDVLNGNANNDILNGGNGKDNLQGSAGNDTLNGDAGDDNLLGGNGDDLLNGGDGKDILNGGNNNDTLNGGRDNDSLQGASGNDTLNGGDGNDSILGSTGDDSLDGGTGNDKLFGGTGDDILVGGDGEDILNGQTGNDTLNGGSGNDSLQGEAGIDIIYGGQGDDMLLGSTGDDMLFGGDDNDVLNGGADNDILHGEDGSDSLQGADGNDVLIGGVLNSTSATSQIDILIGGAGRDAYVVQYMYSASGDNDYALIQDFSIAEDVIELGNGSYNLQNTTEALPTGTGIYDSNGDLLAIIKDYSANALSINASYFAYNYA